MKLQKYVWRLNMPPGWDVDRAVEAMVEPARKVRTLNTWVQSIELYLYSDHVLIAMTLVGHDRWWVSKRAPKVVIGLLNLAGIGHHTLTLVEVGGNPFDRRYSHKRFSDGTTIYEAREGEEEPEPKKCANCPDPAHWLTREGWKSGPGTYRGKPIRAWGAS